MASNFRGWFGQGSVGLAKPLTKPGAEPPDWRETDVFWEHCPAPVCEDAERCQRQGCQVIFPAKPGT